MARGRGFPRAPIRGAAAVAGVTVLKSASSASASSGNISAIQWFVIVLALLSAVVSTLLVMLKPAEKADAADKEAIALDDLLAAMDVFEEENKQETDGNVRDLLRAVAVAEVRERLRGARNRPLPAHSSKRRGARLREEPPRRRGMKRHEHTVRRRKHI